LAKDFGFTEAHDILRDQVKKFAQREILPGVRERHRMDPDQHHYEIIKLRKKMSEVGWTYLNVPEKYGGQKVDHLSVGVICEELSKADYAVGNTLPSFIQVAGFLSRGSEELQDEWFPPLLSCDKEFCFCFTEPGAGSDFASIELKAVRDGNHYVLNGEKSPSTFGMYAQMGVVATKTDPSRGARGITAFFMPMDLPGITRSRIPWLGTRYDGPAIMGFEDVRVPEKYRLGEENKGFYAVVAGWDWVRSLLGLNALAAAEASLEDAMSWAKQRIAFGRPIAKFEGVSFKIAEHYTRVQAAKSLSYRTLWLRDQGLPHTKESSMSKWFGIETAIDAIHDCIVLLGHVGYSEEYLLESRLRDVMGQEIGSGPPQIHKIIIARELMGREFLPY